MNEPADVVWRPRPEVAAPGSPASWRGTGSSSAAFLVAPLKACSSAGPIPGMTADVFDGDGKPARG
jgi:hypothetical protein